MIIIDQKDTYLTQVDKLTHYRRFDVPRGRQLKRVIEFSHSIDSLRHPLIQLSDLVRRRPLQWVIVALVEALNGIAIESFASHPAGLRLPRARLCAAQPSPPFFFVFPRRVRVLPSVARPGLDANST